MLPTRVLNPLDESLAIIRHQLAVTSYGEVREAIAGRLGELPDWDPARAAIWAGWLELAHHVHAALADAQIAVTFRQLRCPGVTVIDRQQPSATVHLWLAPEPLVADLVRQRIERADYASVSAHLLDAVEDRIGGSVRLDGRIGEDFELLAHVTYELVRSCHVEVHDPSPELAGLGVVVSHADSY